MRNASDYFSPFLQTSCVMLSGLCHLENQGNPAQHECGTTIPHCVNVAPLIVSLGSSDVVKAHFYMAEDSESTLVYWTGTLQCHVEIWLLCHIVTCYDKSQAKWSACWALARKRELIIC